MLGHLLLLLFGALLNLRLLPVEFLLLPAEPEVGEVLRTVLFDLGHTSGAYT